MVDELKAMAIGVGIAFVAFLLAFIMGLGFWMAKLVIEGQLPVK